MEHPVDLQRNLQNLSFNFPVISFLQPIILVYQSAVLLKIYNIHSKKVSRDLLLLQQAIQIVAR